MIIKVCTRCLKGKAFVEAYEANNIASCPTDGTCELCKLDKKSQHLRWVAAVKNSPALFRQFPAPHLLKAHRLPEHELVGHLSSDKLNSYIGPSFYPMHPN